MTMENLHDLLRSTREAKGIAIDEVSNRTKIRVKIIETIEQGDFKSAGAPAYVKGFVKIYADYLGLDTKGILKQYAHLFEDVDKPFLMVGKDDEKISPAAQAPNIFFHPKNLLAIIILAGGIAAVVVVGVVVVRMIIRGAAGKAVPRKETIAASPKARPAMKTPGRVSRAGNAPAGRLPAGSRVEARGDRLKTPAQFGLASIDKGITPEDEELVLIVEVIEPVWLRIKSDDQLIFEDTLKKGEKESWKAQKVFQVKIGNAGGVKFTLNNVSLGVQGASGEVKTVEIGQEDLRRLQKKK
jgi:hypothetical protein